MSLIVVAFGGEVALWHISNYHSHLLTERSGVPISRAATVNENLHLNLQVFEKLRKTFALTVHVQALKQHFFN